MCGIFGVIRPQGIRDKERETFGRLSELLRHRGPDGSGGFAEDRVLVGMHRLSIMDLRNGAQPFSDERGNNTVVANGEIYNARDLRSRLRYQGHNFCSLSDIEVIPHLLESRGLRAFQDLNGMFAIAALDRDNGVVHLARDRMGEKPLYVFESEDALWFSSELRPLIRSGCVRASLESGMVSEYLLHGFVPESVAICGVKSVVPGSVLTVSIETGATSQFIYWNPLDYLGASPLTAIELAGTLQQSIVDACESDVAIGVALSGGLDSTLVAAVAARRRQDLKAFTIGYDVLTAHDETRLAEETARALGIEHTTVIVPVSEIGATYGVVTSARDVPIADIAGPSYLALARAFRESGVPVMLSGQGGDELFWGYPWVRNSAYMGISGKLPFAASPIQYFRLLLSSRSTTAEALWTLGESRTRRRIRRHQNGAAAGTVNVPLYAGSPEYGQLLRDTTRLLRHESFSSVPNFSQVPAGTESALYMIAIMQTYLRTNGLAQLDRLSMQESIEARTPLVDHRLVEQVLGSNIDIWKNPLSAKERLRQAALVLAPDLALQRSKRGFTPPVREWISSIWTYERPHVADLALAETGVFRNDLLRSALRTPSGALGQPLTLPFRLLTLELWWRGLA